MIEFDEQLIENGRCRAVAAEDHAYVQKTGLGASDVEVNDVGVAGTCHRLPARVGEWVIHIQVQEEKGIGNIGCVREKFQMSGGCKRLDERLQAVPYDSAVGNLEAVSVQNTLGAESGMQFELDRSDSKTGVNPEPVFGTHEQRRYGAFVADRFADKRDGFS